MERLPYIDEHAITVDADAATTWSALLRVLCRDPADPSTVPFGFVLDPDLYNATPPHRFALKGRHWFSVYKLVFVLSDATTGEGRQRTRVVAETWADFPGVKGSIYRGLVIGTGAHRIIVRAILKRVAAEAHPHKVTTT